MKNVIKQNEAIILGSIGMATVLTIICGLYLLYSKPKFLYMPIYENYEKESDIADEDDNVGTEMVTGSR